MEASNPHFSSSSASSTKSCSACRKSHSLSDFHKKGERLDSRCRFCVSKSKKAKAKKKKRKSIEEPVFNANITGSFSKGAIEQFANVLTTSIKELIEDGSL